MKGPPDQAAAAINRLGRFLATELRAAEKKNVRTMLVQVRRLSQGRFSSARLRRMGHPYRHGGTPPQDPAIINRQSGLFAASWFSVGPQESDDGLESSVANSAPYARFLFEGTGRMIARPTLRRAAERAAPVVQRRRLAAVRKALTRALR